MLPTFKYHPDPIGTGSVVARKDAPCACCGQARGYVYTGPVYGPRELRGALCPWCIADGSAAARFDAVFVDPDQFETNLAREVVTEISTRTPGYSGWQQETWLTCCSDGCEFRGDASLQELKALGPAEVEGALAAWGWEAEHWPEFLRNYSPGGDASVFGFKCRHCGRAQYALDLS
jgi:uncharacterized protein CbrC (UPF0167 family)